MPKTLDRFPMAYSRFTKTHWVLYVRHVVFVQGYTYRRKYKRRWKRVQVPAYRVVSYRELSRDVLSQDAAWISKSDWFLRLESKYENFERSRSDLPATNLKWFRLKNNFLWTHRRWPPLSPDARYVLVLLWILVWDREDKIHKLFVQRLRLIHSSVDMHYGRDLLKNIEPALMEKFEEQKKKLERGGFDSEGVDVKGLAAWSVTPSAEWWIQEERRLEKRHRYWSKRDQQDLRRRAARDRKRGRAS